MTTIETLEIKLRQLPSDMLGEVEDFVEFLLEKRRRAELEQQAVAHGWPPGYFEQTAGSIPDFPDIDGDMSGLDPSLDERDEELRFDPPEGDDNRRAAQ